MLPIVLNPTHRTSRTRDTVAAEVINNDCVRSSVGIKKMLSFNLSSKANKERDIDQDL